MDVTHKWAVVARCWVRHAALYGVRGLRRWHLPAYHPPALFDALFPYTRRVAAAVGDGSEDENGDGEENDDNPRGLVGLTNKRNKLL